MSRCANENVHKFDRQLSFYFFFMQKGFADLCDAHRIFDTDVVTGAVDILSRTCHGLLSIKKRRRENSDLCMAIIIIFLSAYFDRRANYMRPTTR